MKITIITSKVDADGIPFILGAWDERTMNASPEGFQAAVAQYRRSMPNGAVRTAEIEVPEGFLESIYRPIKVHGNVTESNGGKP